MNWDGSFTPGQTLTLTAKFKNTGHYQATNAVATMSSSSNYITINNSPITVGNIGVDEVVSCNFNVTIAANCPETAQIPITFTLTADGNLSAQGSETLKNACNVVFNLSDSYGDGWNGASLTVSFDDGTESQSLTVSSGSSANYVLEIGNGTHVTVTFVSGSYNNECSFSIQYEEGNIIIYQSSGTPSAGILYEFDCNCAIASQTFIVNVSSSNSTYGTVSGGGEFSYGESCTVTATENPGYYFSGWTLDGELVSSEVEYTFNVTSDMNLVANFVEGVLIGDGGTATSQYLPSYNYYKYALTQQIYTAEEIGTACTIYTIAFYNGGAEKTRTYDFYLKATTKSSFSSNTDWVTVSTSDKVFSGSVTMAANAWTYITFNTPFEYDGTSNLVLIADDNTEQWTSSPHMACRTFSASGNQALYVYGDNTNYNPSNPPTSYTSQDHNSVLSQKNQILLGIDTGTPIIEQTFQLGADWNWWSSNLDITLSELKEALGSHGLKIAAQDGKFATYNANSGTWSGNLQSIELGKMYKIMTSEACAITFTSEMVDPTLYPISLAPGNNWIGFISTQSMSLNEAFSGFTPTDRDVIKSANGKATYYQGYGWQGSLNTLEPGKGYIYKSNATGTRTFTYPSAK